MSQGSDGNAALKHTAGLSSDFQPRSSGRWWSRPGGAWWGAGQRLWIDALEKIQGCHRDSAARQAGLLLCLCHISGPLCPSLLTPFEPSAERFCLLPIWPPLLAGIRCQSFLLLTALSRYSPVVSYFLSLFLNSSS